MAFVKEEIKHYVFDATITVLEREQSEFSDPWNIINLEVDSFQNCTPKELRKLGNWLLKQGKRIGKEYKSNGSQRHFSDSVAA